MLFAEERKNQILQLLNKNNKLRVPELCEYFQVSPATIRNDLRELEKSDQLKRTHGGALANQKMSYELDSLQKEVDCLNEKRAIAQYAINLVEDGDTIALDTGTTTFEFAKLLSSKKNMTIVTNDIEIARHLESASSANIILIGGILRKNFHCTIGPAAVQLMNELTVDKAFMGTNGLSIEKGLTTPDMTQAEIKKAIIGIANEIIVLCDSSKIGSKAFVQVAPLSAVDRIVTDSKIDERDYKALLNNNILVDIANI